MQGQISPISMDRQQDSLDTLYSVSACCPMGNRRIRWMRPG